MGRRLRRPRPGVPRPPASSRTSSTSSRAAATSGRPGSTSTRTPTTTSRRSPTTATTLGANPHAGNGRSDAAGGGHAHAGAMIYLGGTWPEEYRGSIFMNNIHGARLNLDVARRRRARASSARHAPDFLLANDRWSQIINLQYGPDGNVYMIDWYDKNQCHRTETRGPRPDQRPDLQGHLRRARSRRRSTWRRRATRNWCGLLASPNDWYARHARRSSRSGASRGRTALAAMAFGDRRDRSVDRPDLRPRRSTSRIGSAASGPCTRRAGCDEDDVARGLAERRARTSAPGRSSSRWRTASPSPATLATVRRAGASPTRRRSSGSTWPRRCSGCRWSSAGRSSRAWSRHAEDADDHNLPLMYWYAAEPLADGRPGAGRELAAEREDPAASSRSWPGGSRRSARRRRSPCWSSRLGAGRAARRPG